MNIKRGVGEELLRKQCQILATQSPNDNNDNKITKRTYNKSSQARKKLDVI